MFIVATMNDAEKFHNYEDAWIRYEETKDKVKGIFKSTQEDIEDLNVSANHFKEEYVTLKNKAKELI